MGIYPYTGFPYGPIICPTPTQVIGHTVSGSYCDLFSAWPQPMVDIPLFVLSPLNGVEQGGKLDVNTVVSAHEKCE